MNEDKEWTLSNVEQICVDTKDIDEICFGLEQLTIFATENIQNLATTILKLNSENQQLKEKYLNAVADYETTKSENQQLHNKINKVIEILECSNNMFCETALEILKDSDVDGK